jgi:hypothetical protein
MHTHLSLLQSFIQKLRGEQGKKLPCYIFTRLLQYGKVLLLYMYSTSSTRKSFFTFCNGYSVLLQAANLSWVPQKITYLWHWTVEHKKNDLWAAICDKFGKADIVNCNAWNIKSIARTTYEEKIGGKYVSSFPYQYYHTYRPGIVNYANNFKISQCFYWFCVFSLIW